MNSPLQPDKIALTPHYKGSSRYEKMSFPVHCGIYTVLETPNRLFHFNLKNEVIRIKDKTGSWPHPHEWLQRTLGGDWVYYSTGGYTGVYEATGEYYLPNFHYSSNNLLGGKPFSSENITSVLNRWYSELCQLVQHTDLPEAKSEQLETILLKNRPQRLEENAENFHKIIGGRISVLPPDARHVHYNVIPLGISKGCLYKCSFCKVKNKIPFKNLGPEEIAQQITSLKQFYDQDIINYNSIFLGEHDALAANEGLILSSLEQAISNLELNNSYPEGVNCFLFGSVSSFLNSSKDLFQSLQEHGGMTYINIGLESPDQVTLNQLGKPISSAMVHDTFHRIQDVNASFSNIEVTANLLMDQSLPKSHYQAVETLLRQSQTFQQSKGAIYFSPLSFDKPSRARLFEFNRLKLMSRFPTFLYIIQRL